MKVHLKAKYILAATIAAATCSRALADDAAVYPVRAGDTDRVDLNICSASRVFVRGTGKIDLDFAIVGPDGRASFDVDETDWTVADLDPGRGCARYTLLVSNTSQWDGVYLVRVIES